MLGTFAKIEIVFGILLLVLSVVLHANSYLCLTENCGGLAGSLATFYGLQFGICLILAGLAYAKGIRWYAAAHLPLLYSIYLATTIS